MINLGDFSGKRICAAVSGGADSMALLHVLKSGAETHGYSLVAVNCEHGIRGQASLDDSLFVKEICEKWGVPLYSFSADCIAEAAVDRVSLETAARNFRYRIFDSLLKERKADLIATAHHLGDESETILFRLCRGSSLSGAKGMEQRRGGYVRPFLNVTKAQILDYVREHEIPFREDMTNFEADATRNKLRLEVLPSLESAVPGAAENLARFARIAAEDDGFLYKLSFPLIEKTAPETNGDTGYRLRFCEKAPLFRRACLTVLKALGVEKDYTFRHLDDVFSLQGLQTGSRIALPSGLQAVRVYDRIIFYRKKAECPIEKFEEYFREGSFRTGRYEITVNGQRENKGKSTAESPRADGSESSGKEPSADGSGANGKASSAGGAEPSGKAPSADGSEPSGEASSADGSESSGETWSAGRSESNGETSSADGSESSGKAPSAGGSESSGKAPSAGGSEPSGETSGADRSGANGKEPSADGSESSGKAPSAGGSESSGETSSAGGSESSGETSSADGSESSGETWSAGRSESSGKAPSEGRSGASGKEPSADGSEPSEEEPSAKGRGECERVSIADGQRIGKENIAGNGTNYFKQEPVENEEEKFGRTLVLDGERVPPGAVFRLKRSGDSFEKFGGGRKTLKKYLTDKKIPEAVRRELPVLADREGNEVYAVCGVEISESVRLTEHSRRPLYITIRKTEE